MENVPFDALPAQATLAGDRSGRVIPTKRSNSAADSNAFSAHLQLRPHSAKTDENPAHGTACRKTDEFLGHDGTYRSIKWECRLRVWKRSDPVDGQILVTKISIRILLWRTEAQDRGAIFG